MMSDDMTVIHVGGDENNATIEEVKNPCFCAGDPWPHKRGQACQSASINRLSMMMVAAMLETAHEHDPSRDPDLPDHAAAYRSRNSAIYGALSWATTLGWQCGIGFDGAEPQLPVAYLDLPGRGQVSWHLAGYPAPYDGHDTAEKYARVLGWIEDFETADGQRADAGPVAELVRRTDGAENG